MAAEGVSQQAKEVMEEETAGGARDEEGQPLSKRQKVAAVMKVDVFNGATACVFDPVPFASGHFRYVHVGKYTAGPRTNENCV
eukprot:1043669-Amphidinium_carterae.1